MNQFDDIAGDLRDIKDKLSKITSVIKDNTKEIKFQTQVRFEITKETGKLQKTYENLGKKVYDLLKEDRLEDCDLSEYTRQIDISIARIESLKTKLEGQSNYDGFDDVQRDIESEGEKIIYVDEEDLKK
ncbi:MAG: hypothetical protein Q4D95_03800 [Peptoniphilus sp.]|nr:hypothetical protein [Peptoniphilus sp.]